MDRRVRSARCLLYQPSQPLHQCVAHRGGYCRKQVHTEERACECSENNQHKICCQEECHRIDLSILLHYAIQSNADYGIRMLLTAQTRNQDFEVEQDSELEADFFFYPESTELVAEQWSGVVIVSEGATPLPNVVVEIGKDSNTLHIICTQVGSSKQSLLPGTYTIVLRREPVGLYTELEVEGSIEIE